MKRTRGNITTEVIEGIRISITAPRNEREKLLEQYQQIKKSVEEFDGQIVDEETVYTQTTLMVSFSDYHQKNAWLRKMRLYGV